MTQQRTADYPMLSEILQLPAFTGCSVCGGTAGLDHRVSGVNVTLATPNHPFLAEERAFADYPDGCHELEYAQPITIGDHCWLCSGVTVCGGVTIGAGSIIAAGAVVTREIPPHSIVAGVPAQVLRQISESDRIHVWEKYIKNEPPR